LVLKGCSFEKQDLRKKLRELDSKLQEKEAQFRSLEQENQETVSEKKVLETELGHLNEQIGTLKKEIHKLEKKLEKSFEKYGQKMEGFEANANIIFLKKALGEFQFQSNKESELLQKSSLLTQAIKQQKSSFTESEKKWIEKKQEREDAFVNLSKFKQDRFDKFEKEDPLEVRKSFQYSIEALQQGVSLKEQELTESRTSLKGQQSLQKNKVKTLNGTQNKSEKEKTKLEISLQNAGFSSIDALESSFLEKAEAQSIEKEKQVLENELLKINGLLQDVKGELVAVIKEAEGIKPLETLTLKLADGEEEYGLIQQSIGAIRQEIDQNESRKESQASLLAEMDKQQSELQRWSALNDVIGQADGKKFRIFAQGLSQ